MGRKGEERQEGQRDGNKEVKRAKEKRRCREKQARPLLVL